MANENKFSINRNLVEALEDKSFWGIKEYIDKDKKDSMGRKITDCEKYIRSGIYEGWCSEISFPKRIKCTYVCDFFEDKIVQ